MISMAVASRARKYYVWLISRNKECAVWLLKECNAKIAAVMTKL